MNIVDTPGHADFGGQVECVLKMSDGVLLLVDASEGPMPQTYFVLKKALELNLPVIVVVNKIDKPNARCSWVLDEVFELMVKLDAPNHLLDFPVIYASAKNGYAINNIKDKPKNIEPLYEKILKHIPAPIGDAKDSTQLLVSLLSFDSFLGRLAIGKITGGSLKIGQDICYTKDGKKITKSRVTKIYQFVGNKLEPIENAGIGEIVAIAGVEGVSLGDTITDPLNPKIVKSSKIDEPTVSMNFLPNDSPFSGLDGKFVNSRLLKERLERETLSDAALKVEDVPNIIGCKVSGRGELHLSVLIEKLRREGFELQVTMPQVIFREENGELLEPYEELTVTCSGSTMGKVMENLGDRRAHLTDMQKENDLNKLIYTIPIRGLLGFRAEFMTLTRGMGTISSIFLKYDTHVGELKNRENGVLINMEKGTTSSYSLFKIKNRGVFFLGAGEEVYGGQIIGIHNRSNDLIVNPCKGKHLTNMRTSSADEALVLERPRAMSLENCLAFIGPDELVEITPKAIRLRKKLLNAIERKRSIPKK